ncbi:hypothetical protein [Actinoplanes aureus]|uniref:Lipoprotein n=1 Tax=Actinoplanes aureus TaxID=2792083 RepID=A0A931FZJ7_9ACTN|nr:hypothetical protein [Actinoplanes aureus]MBG0564837.1 hypothetical protein [Actinoplanes aureus]
MHHGDNRHNNYRFRTAAGALALVAGLLTACTSDSDKGSENAGGPQATSSSAAAAAAHFGPDGFGKLKITMSESEALATGDLQTEPVSTVLGKNVYSFTGGPKPDPSRMAADDKIEKDVVKADEGGFGDSAAGDAAAAEAYAKSAQRISDRLIAYMEAGGASFAGGKLVSIAAPESAATEAGIKRGSQLAELKSAYPKLQEIDENFYELAVEGHSGWTMRFEVEDGVVLYMSLGVAEPE